MSVVSSGCSRGPSRPASRGGSWRAACGSGHFLLGMFERLLGKWREAEPGTEAWVLVRRALESVHGADKNPFAVAMRGVGRLRGGARGSG
ncbi:hypothetical protein ACWDU0_08985 [Streptomyces cellulosae]